MKRPVPRSAFVEDQRIMEPIREEVLQVDGIDLDEFFNRRSIEHLIDELVQKCQNLDDAVELDQSVMTQYVAATRRLCRSPEAYGAHFMRTVVKEVARKIDEVDRACESAIATAIARNRDRASAGVGRVPRRRGAFDDADRASADVARVPRRRGAVDDAEASSKRPRSAIQSEDSSSGGRSTKAFDVVYNAHEPDKKDFNEASVVELQRVPGIGPITARNLKDLGPYADWLDVKKAGLSSNRIISAKNFFKLPCDLP